MGCVRAEAGDRVRFIRTSTKCVAATPSQKMTVESVLCCAQAYPRVDISVRGNDWTVPLQGHLTQLELRRLQLQFPALAYMSIKSVVLLSCIWSNYSSEL